MSELKDEWQFKRKKLFQLGSKRKFFKKGDHRVKSIRHCSICGRPLVEYYLGEYRTVASYTLLDNSFIPIYICKDAETCCEHYKKRHGKKVK